MKSTIRCLLALVTASLLTSATLSSQAANLAQKDLINRDKAGVIELEKRVNRECGGTHIHFSIDYASYDVAGGLDDNKQSPHYLLANAGDALMRICKTEAGKAAVQEKIKEVHGAYSTVEEESLINGVFTYKVGFTGGNVDRPEKWLKEHL